MHNQQQNDNAENILRDQSQQRFQQQLNSPHLAMVALPESRASLQKEIRFNMAYCQANRLSQSAKWLGELLVTVQTQPASSLPQQPTSQKSAMNSMKTRQGNNIINLDDQVMSGADSGLGFQSQNEIFSDSLDESDLPAMMSNKPSETSATLFNKVFFERPSETLDVLNLARTLFDLKEYRKCAFCLQQIHAQDRKDGQPINQSALFLKNYATYLVCEQKSEEQSLESGDKIAASSQGSSFASTSQNKEMLDIEMQLKEMRERKQLNAINLYLLGVILKQKNCKEEAREVLIEALNKMPLLWSAWLELAQLTQQKDARATVFDKLRPHWAKNFYYACFFLDKQQAKDSIDLNSALYRHFKDSVYIMNQIAHASYISQEYDIAIDWFQRLLERDPYRYENLDLYSNILYIKESYGELANLAFNIFQNDKYRPESCCVIGNYYSLRGDHQKSALYFMRAIKLDRKFISAWTLMGHEYLEMKNTSAAIESYRTAVDTDPTDFRAWYGLGQAYEINQMYSYATHYYANAALAKPQDSRMWNAMSNCYNKMGKKAEAKRCSERAERFKDKEGIALHKLAKLYVSIGDPERAAACFKLNLKRKEMEESSETSEALLYLAKHCKFQGKYEEAMQYARHLHDYFGTDREEAGALIREINKSRQLEHNQNQQ